MPTKCFLKQLTFCKYFHFSTEINDDSKLSECNIRDGTTLNLVILTPLYIYVQGVDGKNHTIYVDSEVGSIIISICITPPKPMKERSTTSHSVVYLPPSNLATYGDRVKRFMLQQNLAPALLATLGLSYMHEQF